MVICHHSHKIYDILSDNYMVPLHQGFFHRPVDLYLLICSICITSHVQQNACTVKFTLLNDLWCIHTE